MKDAFKFLAGGAIGLTAITMGTMGVFFVLMSPVFWLLVALLPCILMAVAAFSSDDKPLTAEEKIDKVLRKL